MEEGDGLLGTCKGRLQTLLKNLPQSSCGRSLRASAKLSQCDGKGRLLGRQGSHGERIAETEAKQCSGNLKFIVDSKVRVAYSISIMNTTQPRIGLRARKAAQTKLALLDALVEGLKDRTLEDISVRELCDKVQISEATFFNYFPAKSDLLSYFIALWSIEMAIEARRAAQSCVNSSWAAIERIFAATATQIEQHPMVMMEMIIHQARMTGAETVPEVGVAERLLRFGEQPEIETIQGTGLNALLPLWLNQAVATGELPATTDINTMVVLLASIFFGTPLLLGRFAPAQIGMFYSAQLAVVRSGAQATTSNKE